MRKEAYLIICERLQLNDGKDENTARTQNEREIRLCNTDHEHDLGVIEIASVVSNNAAIALCMQGRRLLNFST